MSWERIIVKLHRVVVLEISFHWVISYISYVMSSPENTSHSSLITYIIISFCLDVNPARSILANIYCWFSVVAFGTASVFPFLRMNDWCWWSGWSSFSLLCLIGLYSSSSFAWIGDTLMLFGLHCTGRGIIELMYSALLTMEFFFNTMSWLELLLTEIRK